MSPSQPDSGYFRSGLPYNHFNRGPRPLVIFQGLMFENKPQSGMVTRMYHFLGADYTGYSVLRKPGMPRDYTMRHMAEDYAAMIREEFGAPTLVIAGERDPFYTATLFRETAAGVPSARLNLYPNMGHPAAGKQFALAVLAFLREGR